MAAPSADLVGFAMLWEWDVQVCRASESLQQLSWASATLI